VPSDGTAKPGEGEALDLLAHILGGGQNSRLYRELVEDKRIAVNAGASYSGTAVDATRFTVYATPRPGTELPALETAIEGVINEIADKGVTAEELTRAKTRMIADAVYAQDNQATMARWYGAALATGSTVEAVQGWTGRIRAVSAEAVRDAARDWLKPQRSVTGYLVKEWPKAGAAKIDEKKAETAKPAAATEKKS
jgi:zinc protease